MANRIQTLGVRDFRGGVNLSTDSNLLHDDEFLDSCNMVIEPRGGIYSRRGWERWGASVVTADAWDPRSMFQFNIPGGASVTMLCNNDKILHSSDGSFSELAVSATAVPADAGWHGADFAPWSDTLYMACGRNRNAHSWSGTGDAILLQNTDSGRFNDDYLTPVQGVMPQCELVATHYNYLFVANTREFGTNRPTRVRWSHPSEPEDFATDDYIDIHQAGEITGLVSMPNGLLVLATNGLWMIFGEDQDSWSVSHLTSSVNTQSPNWVARSEDGVYFFSNPAGVMFFDGESIVDVSESINPIFTDGSFAVGQLDKIFLGYMNRRLWFGVPWKHGEVATDVREVFYLDPFLSERGAWTRFCGSDGHGLGPFVEDSVSSSPKQFGCARTAAQVMTVDVVGRATDDFTGSDDNFASYFMTKWLTQGLPDAKMSWKRPSFVAKESSSDYTVQWTTFIDYEEQQAVRAGTFTVASAATGVKYDDGSTYDSGVKYASAVTGSRLARGGNLGTARSLAMRVAGTPGIPWGIDIINFKTIARRYK